MKKKNRIWIYPLIMVGVLLMFITSCEKDDNDNNNNHAPAGQVPVLTTSAISNITQTTATCGGNITSDGGSTVTARGVCWSTGTTPTIVDSKTTDGTGAGSYTSAITGLSSSTTYYVRAYATNSQGTGYGNILTLTTSSMSIKLFNVGDSPLISNIIESSSGKILVTGTQDNQQSVYVLKLDAAGNQVWNKYYSAGTYVYVNHIFEVSSQGYLVTGTIDATQGRLFKMHFDESGTPSATSYFDCGVLTFSSDEVQLPDGSIIFAGGTHDKDNCNTFIDYGDALISGINTLDIQYFRNNYNYAIGNSDCFHAIVATSDGGFAAAGSTNVYDDGSGYGGPKNAILVKTNALGNLSWTKNFGYQTDDGGNGGAIDLIQLSNGDYAILCCFGYNYKMYIIITDSDGNLKRATNIEGYIGLQFVEAADGGLVIAGQNADANEVVVKVNSLGTKVWEYNVEYHPTAIVKSSDGKYLLAGDAYVDFGVYKSFVLKLDDEGKRVW